MADLAGFLSPFGGDLRIIGGTVPEEWRVKKVSIAEAKLFRIFASKQ
jgi:hypothetical protein